MCSSMFNRRHHWAVCLTCHANTLNSYRYISFWTKVGDELTDKPTLVSWVTPLAWYTSAHTHTHSTMDESALFHLHADRPAAWNILWNWDFYWFRESVDLYLSIYPTDLAGLASALCLMICAVMLQDALYALPSVTASLLLPDIWHMKKPALEKSLNSMKLFPWCFTAPNKWHALNPIQYILQFLHLCFTALSFLYPFVEDLVTKRPLAHCSLTPYFFLFHSHSVHPSPWSCNGFSRCFFEAADSYCVAVDVFCVLAFCLWL